MTRQDDEEQKQIIKEALKEWLDEKFLAFGKWTAAGVAAIVLAVFVYLSLRIDGWHK